MTLVMTYFWHDIATDIMFMMGDLTNESQHLSFDKFYEILMVCRNQQELRDEVFCQLIKQTEENKSTYK